MKRTGFVASALVGLAVVWSLVSVPGCSGESVVTTPKASVESKRDEMQKKTQSGIPGKGGK